jgi:hypothetical protein
MVGRQPAFLRVGRPARLGGFPRAPKSRTGSSRGLQSLPVSPSLRMGRYIAEGLLGPGGVTETFLARMAGEPAERMGRLFALKLLRRDRIPEAVYPEVARRFVTAGEQLLGFRRPGFGRVSEVCGDAAVNFIITEHVAGLDLSRALEIFQADGRPALDPILASLIGSEIARLLHVGHTAKPSFPHLGLSPQNVVITDAGEVVLLDAGIAAFLRSKVEQPPERWWFVAPELMDRDVGDGVLAEREGVAADLYSLGALLRFLVTGRPLDEHPHAGRPDAPPDVEGIPANLSAALRSLLAPDPNDRPESAALLVEWLSSGVDGSRERQRLIGECLRAAEEEARRAAAERAEANAPLAVKLLALARAANGRARGAETQHDRVGRWLVGALVMLAVVISGAGALFLGWPALRMSRIASSPSSGAPTGNASSAAEAGAGPAAPPLLALDDDEVAPDRARILSFLAGRLVAETVPPGATVWVDGKARGTTFTDLDVGPGKHRVVLTLPGYRSFREIMDTTPGAIIRRRMVAVPPEERTGGFVRVECGTFGKYPILIDDEETGHVCPSLAVPTTVGKHTVGIYMPAERRVVTVEVTVEPKARPAMAKFSE